MHKRTTDLNFHVKLDGKKNSRYSTQQFTKRRNNRYENM